MCSLLLCSGCVTTTLLSFTDPQPETFLEYTSAWVGENELIVTYATERGQRWTTIDLNHSSQRNTFLGDLPQEEQDAKKQIPIVIEERQNDYPYYRSRFKRDIEGVNQLGKMYLVGHVSRYRDPNNKIQLIIQPIDNVSVQPGQPISPPKMPTYQPGWTYPARIVGLPIAFCLDVALIPLWFVSYIHVSVRF